MGYDGLRRAEPQELRLKAARGANMSRLGVVGSHNKDVEIDEGSLIGFSLLRSTRKPTGGLKKKKFQSQTKDMRIFQRAVLTEAVCAQPPELTMGTNKPG